MTAIETVQLRWSSTRDCGRKAVLEATGAPARDRTLAEQRQLYRGRSVGHDWVVSVASEKMWKVWIDSGPTHWLPPHLAAGNEDEADVIAELRVQWEMGTGHADLYIRETDTIVEVLSSQNPTGDTIHSKLIQARGYARAVDASNIALIVVDPATLDEQRVIVTSESAQWEDLSRECDERIAQVLAWRDTGTLPGRVCGKPGDAWGHFCVYAEHCFDGWQPPEIDRLDDEDAQALAIRLNTVKTKRREISATDKILKAEQEEIEGQLDPLVQVPALQIGGFKVKRSDRPGRVTFEFSRAAEDARTADLLTSDLFNEFVKRGSPFTVWDVEQNGPTVVYADEQAPWEDEDLV